MYTEWDINVFAKLIREATSRGDRSVAHSNRNPPFECVQPDQLAPLFQWRRIWLALQAPLDHRGHRRYL